ncbi:hypothetical protein RCL_jg428.t1 [Rhizophagus clarus]|uniref:Uncharacterized protein n=1 Tax=Rhizophagus clarus TaxID=94130 RepID=A0A8H3M3Q4_9GLOM|nr:hypothetical protein RCL_jg428.t1 [Rhizophagus clarus]
MRVQGLPCMMFSIISNLRHKFGRLATENCSFTAPIIRVMMFVLIVDFDDVNNGLILEYAFGANYKSIKDQQRFLYKEIKPDDKNRSNVNCEFNIEEEFQNQIDRFLEIDGNIDDDVNDIDIEGIEHSV